MPTTTVHNPDGTVTTKEIFWNPVTNNWQNIPYNPPASSVPLITPPTLSPGAIPTLTPTPKPTFDPLLSPASILGQGQDILKAANAPLDEAVNKIVAPQVPLLTKQINDQLNINKASAQSTFGARGLTGSSTEIQTLTRDLPAEANKALAEGTVKLLTAAYPLAQADKAAIIDATYKSASLSTSLRSVLGDEAFKSMSLDQQRELANQDVQLKLNLADVEMKFQAAMKNAEFAFQHAENEADRAAAQQQFEYLKSERTKARQGAFIKGLTSLAGMGIALYSAPAGTSGKDLAALAAVGATGGNAAGDAFSGLFLLP